MEGYHSLPITQPFDGVDAIEIGNLCVFFGVPDSVSFEPNRAIAVYGKITQVITAEGEGNERHNFVQSFQITT